MSNEANTFELTLKTAASLPLVRIDRDSFLTRELMKYCSKEQVLYAVETNPAQAQIDLDIIDKIAKTCIDAETNKVSALSFAAGIPGGFYILGTVPADLSQYFGHMLRILQKLVYLYGWDDLLPEDGSLDDETANMLTLFLGVMFGVDGAVGAITKISTSAATRASKKLAEKALTKGVLYPIVKKIATTLGIKMTKEVFAKGVAKVIPIIGGAVSGTLTYASFKPCAKKLQKHLKTLKWCDLEYYKDVQFDTNC